MTTRRLLPYERTVTIDETDRTQGLHIEDTPYAPECSRTPASWVTRTNPFNDRFIKDSRYIHTNSRHDHRRNRQRPTHNVTNEPPYDVTTYINNCAEEEVYDGLRFSAMQSNPTWKCGIRTVQRCREEAWHLRWRHTGGYPKQLVTEKPSDMMFVRCEEEDEYQRRLCAIMDRLQQRVTVVQHPEDHERALPSPLTEWYMFDNRNSWVEDAAFEHRTRWPARRTPQEIARRGLYIGWHDMASCWAISAARRREMFFEVTDRLQHYKNSNISNAPNAPSTAYVFHRLTNANDVVRRNIMSFIESETVEMEFHTIVHNAMYGMRFSRMLDPRITTSGTYGILTEVTDDLRAAVLWKKLWDMYEHADVDVPLIMMMMEQSRCIDWTTLSERMTDPFVLYDFHSSRIIPPDDAFERQYTVQQERLVSWCVRGFAAVDIPFKTYKPSTYKQCQTVWLQQVALFRKNRQPNPTQYENLPEDPE